VVPGIEPLALLTLDKHSVTELHLQHRVFYSVSVIDVSVLLPLSLSLHLYHEIEYGKSSKIVPLLQNCFAHLVFFVYDFHNELVVSKKTSCWDFDWDCIGENGVFPTSSLLVHEYMVSF
jgi:hypothetical protein